CLQHDSFPPTF
nr:immunoglobulin light chain junction region [Macaca mulatta]MOY12527.1 immunoglobulin light chain junction region [Macaca mulatta]